MRPLVKWLLAAALGAQALPALALGIAAPDTVPAWGRPLDLRLKLSGLQGEESAPGCYRVEVVDGEVELPGTAVHWSVEDVSGGQAWLRVRTSQALREPVVRLNVASHCGTQLMRSVTLLPEVGGREAAPAPTTTTTMAAAERPTAPDQPSAALPSADQIVAAAPPAGGRAEHRPVRVVRARARSAMPAVPTAVVAKARVPRSRPTLTLSAPVLERLAPAALASLDVPMVAAAVLPADPQTELRGVREELARLNGLVRNQQDVIARLQARPVAPAAATTVVHLPLAAFAGVCALVAMVLFARLRRLRGQQAPWWDSSVLEFLDETERQTLR